MRELQKTVRIDPSLRAFGFQFPVISCGATYAGKMVLGDVPLEEDGSAYFRVPSGIPIYFMVLDKHGRALQRMRSFTHLMPGETQGCVGCHEPRLSSPPIARSLAYEKAPKDLLLILSLLSRPREGRGPSGRLLCHRGGAARVATRHRSLVGEESGPSDRRPARLR